MILVSCLIVLKNIKEYFNCEQSLEHWLLNCSTFNEIRNDINNNLDIIRSFFNSDSRNNSSEIGLNNSSHEISNNSDSVNENLSVNNLSVNNSSVNRSIFNFLLGGRRNNNRNQIEWENLCKYQLKSGSLSDIPFLAKTAAFFNKGNAYCFWPAMSANADNTGEASTNKFYPIKIYFGNKNYKVKINAFDLLPDKKFRFLSVARAYALI
ncbi:hypothetical protein PIROE2DRAFT_15914 [Piromyces sp. E2]|nr:hypothetical protein PIROE2DRAFT_15914 [Piromyces sp. E2]|eukprot:OUM58738.1 hypothetical protein PIROE2DRAFT_15914 [Piromyces sp. E2]